jgi:hypothetical protein
MLPAVHGNHLLGGWLNDERAYVVTCRLVVCHMGSIAIGELHVTPQ